MAQLAREKHEGARSVVENGSEIGRRAIAILAAWTLVAMLLAGQAWVASQVRGGQSIRNAFAVHCCALVPTWPIPITASSAAFPKP